VEVNGTEKETGSYARSSRPPITKPRTLAIAAVAKKNESLLISGLPCQARQEKRRTAEERNSDLLQVRFWEECYAVEERKMQSVW
jgi:hypothetical protein